MMINVELKRDSKFLAAFWLLPPDDPRRRKLEEIEFYIPKLYFESSIKQLRGAYKLLHNWITAKLAGMYVQFKIETKINIYF